VLKASRWVLFALLAALLAAGAGSAILALQDRSSESDWESRDGWQRPQDVMDELGLHAGSAVADIGAGRGYFAFRLAERVGANGKVYAVDIDESDLQGLARRAREQNLSQIETVHGATDDPRLPDGCVDAILVVNAYHEMRDFDAMLQGMFRALRPRGRLAIIDEDSEPGKPRSSYQSSHEIPASLVEQDAERNGFRLLRRPKGFQRSSSTDWYFLLFEKPAAQALRTPSVPLNPVAVGTMD